MATQSKANVKRLTCQPEHLRERAQQSEHDGFTDAYMCMEVMGSPSHMSIFIEADKPQQWHCYWNVRGNAHILTVSVKVTFKLMLISNQFLFHFLIISHFCLSRWFEWQSFAELWGEAKCIRVCTKPLFSPGPIPNTYANTLSHTWWKNLQFESFYC